MLRKLIIGAIVANFVFMLFGVITSTEDYLVPLFANTTIGGSAGATVPNVLELASGGIRQIPANATAPVNPWLFPTTNTYNFGTLKYDSTEGYFIGEYYYVTLMVPVSSGRPFTIYQSGTALTGASGSIPNTAFLNIPDYQYLDELPVNGVMTPQNAMPADAYCGPVTSAVAAPPGNIVYKDPGTSGESRIVRGIVAIGGPEAGELDPVNYAKGHNGAVGITKNPAYTGWAPATPSNTKADNYSGSVTYTLTTP